MSCTTSTPPSPEKDAAAAASSYLDSSGRTDRLSGGVRMIPINTPKGTFNVWTKRVGNNPRIKVLLLHGGPGATHEYFEAADSFLPAAGVEYYYYDQLGSAYSDQPKDTSLWDLPRFVEEVEQVRQALGLDNSNFYLLGHSWGGMLAIEYALKYQEHLKGLVISNMMASIPAYNEYARAILMPKMDQAALKEILALEKKKDFNNPRYEELLIANYYIDHILRLPPEQWPEPVTRSFGKLNRQIYVMMQGPSEMGSSGTLERWSRVTDLPSITVPTLVIGATHDTMDPGHMQMIADSVGKGRFLLCSNGSHMAMYDDQQRYFAGLTTFLRDVDTGAF
jgi:proline iminopeptidase